MKKNKLNIKTVIAIKAQQYLSMTIIILLVCLSSACQMTAPDMSKVTEQKSKDLNNYSLYYLSLKSLTNKEILAEEKQLKTLVADKSRHDQVLNEGKLILIYSLTTASLHQPYKAKRLLNEHLLTGDSISKENFAFTTLLRDQLNRQLNLLQSQQMKNNDFKEQSAEHHLLIDRQHQQIETLNQQLEQVNKQLKLLKRIDQNINERG